MLNADFRFLRAESRNALFRINLCSARHTHGSPLPRWADAFMVTGMICA